MMSRTDWSTYEGFDIWPDDETPQPSGERPGGMAVRREDPCKGVAAPSQPTIHRPVGMGYREGTTGSGPGGYFDAYVGCWITWRVSKCFHKGWGEFVRHPLAKVSAARR